MDGPLPPKAAFLIDHHDVMRTSRSLENLKLPMDSNPAAMLTSTYFTVTLWHSEGPWGGDLDCLLADHATMRFLALPLTF